MSFERLVRDLPNCRGMKAAIYARVSTVDQTCENSCWSYADTRKHADG
jgi:hypothetical protein